MNKKIITIIIAAIVVATGFGIYTYSKSNNSKMAISTNGTKAIANLSSKKTDNIKNLESTTQHLGFNGFYVETPDTQGKLDFSKYTNNDLIKFVNDATENYLDQTIHSDSKSENQYIYEKLDENKYTKFIGDTYVNGVASLDFVTLDGMRYLKTPIYENPYPYIFNSVISKEEINNNTLKVVFNAGMLSGYPATRNQKTVYFTIQNGTLKAKSLIWDNTFVNTIQNLKDEKPNMNIDEKKLWDFANEKLKPILRKDQHISGIDDRHFDTNTDTHYYGITVSEPTQNSVIFYINQKDSSIYGMYQHKFVYNAPGTHHPTPSFIG